MIGFAIDHDSLRCIGSFFANSTFGIHWKIDVETKKKGRTIHPIERRFLSVNDWLCRIFCFFALVNIALYTTVEAVEMRIKRRCAEFFSSCSVTTIVSSRLASSYFGLTSAIENQWLIIEFSEKNFSIDSAQCREDEKRRIFIQQLGLFFSCSLETEQANVF